MKDNIPVAKYKTVCWLGNGHMIFPGERMVKVDGHWCCLKCVIARKIDGQYLDKEIKEVMKDVG